MSISPEERERRFWARVQKTDSCWLWTGVLTPSGYAHPRWEGRHRYGHHITWILLRGPIPEGLEADHLCRVRRCVNPDHIEWVTHYVNTARAQMARGTANANGAKTHCRYGHEYTPENTRIDPYGHRVCRACHRGKESERQWAQTHCANGHERTPENIRIDASGRRRCAVCHPGRT